MPGVMSVVVMVIGLVFGVRFVRAGPSSQPAARARGGVYGCRPNEQTGSTAVSLGPSPGIRGRKVCLLAAPAVRIDGGTLGTRIRR